MVELIDKKNDYSLYDEVILIDENDNQIGTCEKLKAHQEGLLHRAFSIFIFNPEGKLLIQKRAINKYHSGGLWSNTCCSHPRVQEKIELAAHRRLLEEVGFDCSISEIFSFHYKVDLGNNIFEHEYDHVFIGKYDGEVKPNTNEVAYCDWVNTETLLLSIKENPYHYTYWLKYILNYLLEYIKIKSYGGEL